MAKTWDGIRPLRKSIKFKKNSGLRKDKWGPPAFKRLAEEKSTEHNKCGQRSGKKITIFVWSFMPSKHNYFN